MGRKRNNDAPKNNSMIVRLDDLLEFEALTKNQQYAITAWDEGDHLALSGSAGTGKTFLGMFLGLEEILSKPRIYEQMVIVRSIVTVREIGFLPGTYQEKIDTYTAPYKSIASELFGDSAAFNKMVNANQLIFESTSFMRGVTYDNSVIMVDEMQNLNFHELDSIITRIGRNCRIIFAGDYLQTDFKHEDEKNGVMKFMAIVEQLKNFTVINFGWDDIVRSDFVRDYIMTKEMLKIS